MEGGNAGYIDTNIIRDGEKTYHVTKSHAEQIIMEVTTAKDWWNYETTEWERVQSHIGEDRYGAVEGPAAFKDHSKENSWYLFVDDLPEPGYQPMYSNDLSKGFDYLDSEDYFLTTHTKHGGVISLTKAQYDAIRNADAVSAVREELGAVEVEVDTDIETLAQKLPQTAEVNLAYELGTSELPVVWDVSTVDLKKEGSYEVKGIVQSISSNKDQWVGKDGSVSYLAEDKKLYSSSAIQVTFDVQVIAKSSQPDPEKPEPENPNPEKPNPENPDPENPNPEKPESGKGEAVKTGDTANTVLWMMWVGISVSAMALTLRKGKVKR